MTNSQAGRNWEGFGADPFLIGEAAYETIIGMQSTGVQACAKHYVNKCGTFSSISQTIGLTDYFHPSEQEHARTTSTSNVDDRTQHEIYALPFLRSVMAGVASVMCSYSTSPS